MKFNYKKYTKDSAEVLDSGVEVVNVLECLL